jgi:calcineurin-like phosphoesterase family protein
MSRTIFFISDSHFGHKSIINFKNQAGQPLRVRPSVPSGKLCNFTDVEEMDEYMIERWNAVVRPQDKVYHLGDFIVKKAGGPHSVISRLNGKLRLVRGNHDLYRTKDYLQAGVEEVYGQIVGKFQGMLLSHIPVHPASLGLHAEGGRKFVNIHGHIHSNYSWTPFTPHLGPGYFNVSCEVLNYTPISLEGIRKLLSWQDSGLMIKNEWFSV